jgi:hypothetical protein
VLEVVGRGVGGRAAWLAALVLVVSGCAGIGQSAESPSPLGSPSPSASPLPLTIISATFHNGEVGIDYAPVTLVASGGVSPYSWRVTAGAMPAGLTISDNGTLGGTPKAAGTFRFTLQVTDSTGGTAKVAKSFAIARALKATLVPACATQCLVEVGCVNVCGKFGTLVGGVGPFTYTSLGNLPAGLRLSGLSLAGTFTSSTPRYYTFTVNVTDSLGAHTSVSPTFNVFPHLTFIGGSCQASPPGGPCTTGLQYTVGVSETPSVKVVGWTGQKTCGLTGPTTICPAPPFSATVAGNVVTVTVGPTLGANLRTKGTFRLSLSDQFPCGSGVRCSATASLNVDLTLP